jgi:hypothetical protein
MSNFVILGETSCSNFSSFHSEAKAWRQQREAFCAAFVVLNDDRPPREKSTGHTSNLTHQVSSSVATLLWIMVRQAVPPPSES